MAYDNCIDHGKRGSSNFGYASAWFDGKTILAHRVVYCIANGLLPEHLSGIVIRHSCDNPRCVNHNHLMAGTTHDNVQDRVSRSRSKGAPRKLSADDVLFIRSACKPLPAHSQSITGVDHTLTYNGIAKRLGVDSTVIRNVYLKRTYKDIK